MPLDRSSSGSLITLRYEYVLPMENQKSMWSTDIENILGGYNKGRLYFAKLVRSTEVRFNSTRSARRHGVLCVKRERVEVAPATGVPMSVLGH
jgi:hypothetical protein